MELYDMGIKMFHFKDLPDDLKFQRGIQKAKDLGLLRSMGIVKGRHMWKIVPSKISKKMVGTQNTKDYKKMCCLQNKKECVEGDVKMSLEPVEAWIEELKKRGIKTFEHRDLPNDLKNRSMIIKAKYANKIKKSRIATTGSKGSTIRIVWEVT
jgi:hypothetical protein